MLSYLDLVSALALNDDITEDHHEHVKMVDDVLW